MSERKIRVLIVTGGHNFEQEPFFKLFKDNPEITFQAAEHPNAHALLRPEAARQYDVLVLYDMHQEITDEDSVFVTLRFADGSNGSIAYLAEGDKAISKERIEIFGARKSLAIDDFRSTTASANGREKKTRLRAQDKGQNEQARAVCKIVLEGESAPIALEDLATTTRATFRIRESLRTGLPVEV